MEKRKGVALISVIILFAFTSILAMSVLTIYNSSVKQNVAQREDSVLEYDIYSGINVIQSYIVNTNDEFLEDYNDFLKNHNRDEEFIIDLENSGIPVSVSITSVKTPETDEETDITNTKVVYTIVAKSNDTTRTKSRTSTVTQIDTDGASEFEIGSIQ